MKRIAQTQDTNNEGLIDQSVMLSPRTLLTGPRQIVRLERQYRSLSEDFQNALDNLTRTKDSYVSALQNFEQADAYMRHLMPKVKNIVNLLNYASTNKQYLDQAAGEIQILTSNGVAGSKPVADSQAPAQPVKTAQTNTQPWWDTTMQNLANTANSAKTNPSPIQGSTSPQVTTNNEQVQVQQQVNALRMQLNAFVSEMQRHYKSHKQRADAMAGQYAASKNAYAKTRAELMQLQSDITKLHTGLSGWNERLVEYYVSGDGA